MLIPISVFQRGQMFRAGVKPDSTITTWATPAIMATLEHWASSLSAQQAMALMFIIRRTIGAGRTSEAVTTGEFSKALGVAERTVHAAVDALCNEDFINIYVVEGSKSSREFSARVYEIDFKKVFEGDQNLHAGMKKHDLPPAEIAGVAHVYTYRYFVPMKIHGLGKPNLSSPVFDAAIETGKTIERNTVGESMYATPKKQRVRAERIEKISEVISTTLETKKATQIARATLASARPAAVLTKQNLQALIDKHMQRFLPKSPRMLVTDKAFGLMKKRLKESNLPDLNDFMQYVVMYWDQLAAGNRKVYLKDPGRKGSPLPEAPQFAALAYRLPYFVTSYANHSSSKTLGVAERSIQDTKIEQLKKALAQSQATAHSLMRSRRPIGRSTPPEKVIPPQRAATPATRTLSRSDDDLSEWTIPEWTSHKQKA